MSGLSLVGFTDDAGIAGDYINYPIYPNIDNNIKLRIGLKSNTIMVDVMVNDTIIYHIDLNKLLLIDINKFFCPNLICRLDIDNKGYQITDSTLIINNDEVLTILSADQMKDLIQHKDGNIPNLAKRKFLYHLLEKY